MKHLYLNLKRFDVPEQFGGVNSIAPMAQWAQYIVLSTQQELKRLKTEEVEFVQFFPEAHILKALEVQMDKKVLQIGCQGVYRMNTSIGGNFGAFTTNRPASSMKAMGCTHVIIGHCEERNDKAGVLSEAGVENMEAVNRLLNQEIRQAVGEGMKVLYCVGEKENEQGRWKEILKAQLEIGLDGIDRENVVIAYEPVWSIGPGKTPADKDYIIKTARFIKEVTGGLDVVYGGGLKTDNARMLAEIEEIDGGLIALTRFQGKIGFYPDEYLEIIKTYLGK